MDWLLQGDNPAIKYRTQTELLDIEADKAPVLAWLRRFLPADWAGCKGLWLVYYLSSFAECGLTFEDTGLNTETVIGFGDDAPFDGGCGDFMRLRALVRLGFTGSLPSGQSSSDSRSASYPTADFSASTA